MLGVMVLPASAAPKKLLVVTITTGFRHGPAIDEAEKVLPQLADKSAGEFSFDFLSQPGPRPGVGKAPERGPKMTDAEWAAAQQAHKEAQDKARTEEATWSAKVKGLFAEKFSEAGLKPYDGVVFCNTTGELPPPGWRSLSQLGEGGEGLRGHARRH